MAKELTEKQAHFMSELRERGFSAQNAIVKELNYTSFYRDRRNIDSGLSKALKEFQDEVIRDVANSKGGNLNVIARIRDFAVDEGDYKSALSAAKLINDMMGHNAPKTQISAKITVDTIVDLTKPAKFDETGQTIYDVTDETETI
jgi:hypothetical protein